MLRIGFYFGAKRAGNSVQFSIEMVELKSKECKPADHNSADYGEDHFDRHFLPAARTRPSRPPGNHIDTLHAQGTRTLRRVSGLDIDQARGAGILRAFRELDHSSREGPRVADSPVEGDGFEPSVPSDKPWVPSSKGNQ